MLNRSHIITQLGVIYAKITFIAYGEEVDEIAYKLGIIAPLLINFN